MILAALLSVILGTTSNFRLYNNQVCVSAPETGVPQANILAKRLVSSMARGVVSEEPKMPVHQGKEHKPWGALQLNVRAM